MKYKYLKIYYNHSKTEISEKKKKKKNSVVKHKSEIILCLLKTKIRIHFYQRNLRNFYILSFYSKV